jgi:hypothetical protein
VLPPFDPFSRCCFDVASMLLHPLSEGQKTENNNNPHGWFFPNKHPSTAMLRPPRVVLLYANGQGQL